MPAVLPHLAGAAMLRQHNGHDAFQRLVLSYNPMPRRSPGWADAAE